jgi:hypothetical protein
LGLRIWNGNSREQGLSIGVLRILIEFPIRCEFHDAAQIHNSHAVADMLHHAQVVGNKKIRKPHLFLELNQQVDHLSLDGDIEGRNGFIAYDGPGVEGQCPCNADSLSLASTKFMRISPSLLRMEPDLLHEERHPITDLPSGCLGMISERFSNDLSYCHARVQ